MRSDGCRPCATRDATHLDLLQRRFAHKRRSISDLLKKAVVRCTSLAKGVPLKQSGDGSQTFNLETHSFAVCGSRFETAWQSGVGCMIDGTRQEGPSSIR